VHSEALAHGHALSPDQLIADDVLMNPTRVVIKEYRQMPAR
jgi:hypothetical protein